MVKGKPYVHWKIKDETDLTNVDPAYLWGTVIETDKGPINEPVIIKNAEQGKRIFNYDFTPFFANGGRYIVVVRAYGQDSVDIPTEAVFSIVNEKDVEYLTVKYVNYEKNGEKIGTKSKGVIFIEEDTLDTDEPIAHSALEDMPEGCVEQYVAFSAGRWRITTNDPSDDYYGKAIHYYYADVTQSGAASIITPEKYKTSSKQLTAAKKELELRTERKAEVEAAYPNAESDYNSAMSAYEPLQAEVDRLKGILSTAEPTSTEYQDAEAALPDAEAAAIAAFAAVKETKPDADLVLNARAALEEQQVVVDNLTQEVGKYQVLKAEIFADVDGEDRYYYAGTKSDAAIPANELEFTFTKAFNQSLVKQLKKTVKDVIPKGEELVHLRTKYPGDFEIPIAINPDTRGVGYRISIQESDNYTLLLSGANTPKNIATRINERAENITATITKMGEVFNSLLLGTLQEPPKNLETKEYYPYTEEDGTTIINNSALYDELAMSLPVDSIFSPISKDKYDLDVFRMELAEVQDYFAEGSNGPWNIEQFRIPQKKQVAAHEEALSYLSSVKLAGIFCMYGENDIQQAYVDHVSTTEPGGMNSEEVCKWRQLIIGANAIDRIPSNAIDIQERALPLYDKAIAADNQYIMYLGQGLIDDGYVPATRPSGFLKDDGEVDKDALALSKANFEGGKDYQLLPYQCTQYIAGLRSGLFYGASIFGGQDIKRIRGVGNLEIAPLFADENKVLWQPDTYVLLNEYGVLTFTNEYGQISLTDGVTTRQDPLQEDEEGVVSIVKYAQHNVHEVLLQYIGRNITGDLQTGMEVEVRNVLNSMYATDKTLIDLPDEGYSAFDVEIVLAPKSNTQQLLSKVYVYLKLTPVHALRQIEVELTVQ